MSRRELSETVRSCGSRRALAERRVRQVDPAVEGDRVVDGGHQRQPHRLDRQHPVADRLVVVDDVEVVRASLQQLRHPTAEGAGLRERPGAHREELEDVDEVAELAQLRHAERVGLAVEIEARHRGEPDAFVELGIGLAGEDLDVVAEPGELAAEVAEVDALPPAVRLAAVGQQSNSHRRVPPRSYSRRGPRRPWEKVERVLILR
jgi:hypothetical protein